MQSQQIIASLSVVSNFVGGVITCVVLLFLGPWSDSSGRRKPVIIIPIIGMMATSVGLLILQAFPKVSTAWAIYMEVLPLSFGGSNHLLMMATFSYLGDVSSTIDIYFISEDRIALKQPGYRCFKRLCKHPI